MTREQLIETTARALCARIYPSPDFKPEGSQWPSAWERSRVEFHQQATAALSAIEAAGCVVVPVDATSAMIRDGVSYRLSTKIGGDNGWPEDTKALYTAMITASPYRRGE